MKKVFILITVLFLIFFTGCYSNLPNLTLSKVEWYTTTEKYNDLTFGFIHLKVSGLTEGDKVTVITYGDGVITEQELDLDLEKHFNQDVIIKFTHMADNEPRIHTTVITAYKGCRYIKVNLKSEELTYLK